MAARWFLRAASATQLRAQRDEIPAMKKQPSAVLQLSLPPQPGPAPGCSQALRPTRRAARSRASIAPSELVPRAEPDDVGIAGDSLDRRAGEPAVLQREQQVSAWTVNHIAGNGAIPGKILNHRSAVDIITAKLVREIVVHADRSIEFKPLRRSLFQLSPAAHIVQQAEIVAAGIRIRAVDKVLVCAFAQASQTGAPIGVPAQLKAREERHAQIKCSCPRVEPVAQRR